MKSAKNVRLASESFTSGQEVQKYDGNDISQSLTSIKKSKKTFPQSHNKTLKDSRTTTVSSFQRMERGRYYSSQGTIKLKMGKRHDIKW